MAADQLLIDQVLEKEGLHSRNAPQELSGVKTFDPKEDTPVEIITQYHEKECVKCSCGVNKLHKNGIVVLFENGNQGLMGLDCARRDFGDTVVNNLERDFDAKRRTAINKAFVAPALKRIDENRALMNEMRGRAKTKDDFFSALKSMASDVYEKLEVSSHKEFGRWTRDEIVKRTAVDKFGTQKTVREVQKAIVFTIDGHKAIGLDSFKSLNNTIWMLDRAEHFIKIEPYQDKYIDTARTYLRDAEQKVKAVQEQLNAAKSFFTPQNLKAITDAVQTDELSFTQVKLTKRKIGVPSCSWEKNFEYIDIPYSLAGLMDDGSKKVA